MYGRLRFRQLQPGRQSDEASVTLLWFEMNAIEKHGYVSKPNVSTLLFSVFIRGDLRLLHGKNNANERVFKKSHITALPRQMTKQDF